MAAITKNTSPAPSLASMIPPHTNRISGLVAGMDLADWDACYIDATTNKIFKAMDTGASTAQSNVHGYAGRKVISGQVCTLFFGVEVNYTAASGLTPGASVYLSDAVAGGLDTAAKNSHAPVGFAVTDRLVRLRERLV